MSDKDPIVEQFMTPAPRSISRTQTIDVALRTMRELEIRHLPVLEGGRILGLVSERELEIVGGLASVDPQRTSLEQAMIADPFQVEHDVSLRKLAADMAEKKVGSAVVTRNGKLVGIFTTTDALKALSASL